MTTNLNLLHTIIDKNDKRSECRFEIADFDLWNLTYNHKFMPAQWIVNLSQDGVSIRTGIHNNYQVGDVLPIRIQYYNDTVIDCQARVQWKKPFANSLNMEQLGLIYVSTENSVDLETIDKQHDTEKLKRISSALKQNPLPPAFEIMTRHFIIGAVSMFALGFFLNI